LPGCRIDKPTRKARSWTVAAAPAVIALRVARAAQQRRGSPTAAGRGCRGSGVIVGVTLVAPLSDVPWCAETLTRVRSALVRVIDRVEHIAGTRGAAVGVQGAETVEPFTARVALVSARLRLARALTSDGVARARVTVDCAVGVAIARSARCRVGSRRRRDEKRRRARVAQTAAGWLRAHAHTTAAAVAQVRCGVDGGVVHAALGRPVAVALDALVGFRVGHAARPRFVVAEWQAALARHALRRVLTRTVTRRRCVGSGEAHAGMTVAIAPCSHLNLGKAKLTNVIRRHTSRAATKRVGELLGCKQLDHRESQRAHRSNALQRWVAWVRQSAIASRRQRLKRHHGRGGGRQGARHRRDGNGRTGKHRETSNAVGSPELVRLPHRLSRRRTVDARCVECSGARRHSDKVQRDGLHLVLHPEVYCNVGHL
jgi:hypothetical protein